MNTTKGSLLVCLFGVAIVVAGGVVDAETLPTDKGSESEAVQMHRRVVVHCDPGTEDCDDNETLYTMVAPHHPNASFLGVQLTSLTPELRLHFGVEADRGVMVSKVIDDSPAFRAGLEPGDIITAIDDEAVATQRDVIKTVRRKSQGDLIELDIWRDGSHESITAMLEERLSEAFTGHRDIRVDCGEDDDCAIHVARIHHGMADFECQGDGPCTIEIQCNDDEDCTCSANGEVVDCNEIPGFHGAHRK